MNKQTNTPNTPKGTKVTLHGQEYSSIAALCKAHDIEPYSKDYRRIKRRISDLGFSVEEAIEGRERVIAQPPSTKLTTYLVKMIRKVREEEGLSYVAIGKMFNVSHSTVQRIVNRTSWAHVK